MITILDVAIAEGARVAPDGSITGEEFNRLCLPMFGGCEICRASIAAWNACPTRSGYLRCRQCVGDTGFDTYEQYNAFDLDTTEGTTVP